MASATNLGHDAGRDGGRDEAEFEARRLLQDRLQLNGHHLRENPRNLLHTECID